MKHTIELGVDHPEAVPFAEWLAKRGHTVTIGRSTGSYVDGRWTSADPAANEALNAAWEKYCDAH